MYKFRMIFNTVAVDPALQKVQIKEITILLAASLLIPFIIHLIPSHSGIPLGAVLLPMFYVPLVAVIFYRFHTALSVTAFGPVLNYLLTGNPRSAAVPLLTIEVLLFVIIMIILFKYEKLSKVSALISVVAALLISSLIFGLISNSGFSGSHLLLSIQNALPGIILLSVMNPILLHLRKKI